MGGNSSSSEILASVFGEFYSMTDRCHQGRTEFNGTPRSFTNLSSMGWENALSRVPLGVHFRIDCEAGVNLGNLAAKRALEINPKIPNGWTQIAIAFNDLQMPDSALVALRQAKAAKAWSMLSLSTCTSTSRGSKCRGRVALSRMESWKV